MDSRNDLGKRGKPQRRSKERAPCLWEQLKSAMAHIGGEHSFYLPDESEPFSFCPCKPGPKSPPDMFHSKRSSLSLLQSDTSSAGVSIRPESSSSTIPASSSTPPGLCTKPSSVSTPPGLCTKPSSVSTPGLCTKPSPPRPKQFHETSSTTSPRHTQSTRIGKQREQLYFPDLSPESLSENNDDVDSDDESSSSHSDSTIVNDDVVRVTGFLDDVTRDSPRKLSSRNAYSKYSKFDDVTRVSPRKLSSRTTYSKHSKFEDDDPTTEKPDVDAEFLAMFNALNRPNVSKTRRDACNRHQNRRPQKWQQSRDLGKTTHQKERKQKPSDKFDEHVPDSSKFIPSPGHKHSHSSHKPTRQNQRHNHVKSQIPNNTSTQNKGHSLRDGKPYSLMPGRTVYYV